MVVCLIGAHELPCVLARWNTVSGPLLLLVCCRVCCFGALFSSWRLLLAVAPRRFELPPFPVAGSCGLPSWPPPCIKIPFELLEDRGPFYQN
jgi:hypothetical protein